MSDPFDLQLLPPEQTRFYRTPGGLLAMMLGGANHPEVMLTRAYPFSHTREYISVRSPKGEELGLLESIDELEPASRQAVEDELRNRYLTPQVLRIEKIRQAPGLWIWELQTTQGFLKLAMRNLHEHVQNPLPGRLMLTDLDGGRVEIVDYRALDAHSQKQLDRVL